MKTIHIRHLCAMLLAAITFAACSSDSDDTITKPETPADDIHFTAVFGVKNASTRALSDPGNGTLTASWQTGEEIAIVFGGNKYIAEVVSVDGSGSATVSATLPGSTPNNQAVTFVYPASAADGSGVRSGLLASQDGTLASLSSQLDIATATGSLIVNGTEAMPNGSVALENQFAVCKLQFTDESNAAITDITRVTITDLSTNDVITVTPSTAQSSVYVAMPPCNNSVKFVVECTGSTAYKKIANSNLQAGKFYHPTLTATFDAEATPLTFEVIESGTITFENKAENSVYYSIDGGALTEIRAGGEGITPTLNTGQKVSFYGDNDTYMVSSKKSLFRITAGCYIYGNIMSLINASSFSGLKELTDYNTFYGLFRGCKSLRNHPAKQILLPATTLTESCYEEMFSNCKGLTVAPELPATTLTSHCYDSMFTYCTSLTTAPLLPATTLVSHCYFAMFLGCNSLTTAPELPAKGLAPYCYAVMFQECASLTTAPELPATTLAPYCYTQMFLLCTSLTAAPDLPAPTLTDGCYDAMFCDCTNLSSIKCLATDISASSCTSYWLADVAASGTFTKAASMTGWGSGANGIPSGWTVVNAQ